ncbi:T9SS type A sorting domain-containing protein [Flavobacterium sp. CYK-4]|uniref:T9SS type A sorting domain-containing protein n=1 Tax=Flavobacterium lotistagni TaxID=2709660 RepID=UPI001409BB61|nr:T9SS type A sorting domain-containing protein [Flavobacterium lotistagni]NHM07572.1 T9SS type A sorting domain-containing protein [Flavobacterium lotistagni]
MKTHYYLKNILLLIFCLNWSEQSTAQVTEVIAGLSSPYGLAVDEAGNLFIAESGTVNGNKVSMMYLPDQVAQSFDLFTSLNQPTRLKIDNNYLYVVETGGNRISRFNMLVAPPQLVPYITTGLTSPIGLDVKSNIVLVGDYGSYAIRKILTNTPPFQSSTAVNDLATDIVIEGDNFYYANPDYGRVNYNSLVNPSPVDESLFALLTAPASLLIHDNYLYTADKATGNIDRINLTGSSTFPQRVISELNNPQSMVVYNNQLYIAEMGANRIVKFDLNSLSQTSFNRDIPEIYVNPSQNILTVSAETKIKIAALYDLMGKAMKVHLLSSNTIDISALSTGAYLVELTDGNHQVFRLKFIKS